MTKTAENPVVRYAGDNATLIFDTTFEVFALTDIKVTLLDANGAAVATAIDGAADYDYTLSGVFDGSTERYTDAQVTFNTALPTGYLLGLTREGPQTQELDLTQGAALPSESLEIWLDRIVAMAQDLREQLRRAILENPADTTQIDVGARRLTGLADPTGDTDAATRQWVNAQLTGSGIKGEKGDTGDAGATTVAYQIRSVAGTAIKNGTGTLTIEAISITGATAALLASGSIQLYVGTTLVNEANGYATGSDGYTGVFDSDDINDSVVVTLREGPTGQIHDSITLIDVADGATSNATSGSVNPSNGLYWRKDAAGTWAPAQLTSDLVCTFYQNGAAVSTGTARATLDAGTGLITFSEVSSDATVNLTFVNNGTASPTVEFEETSRNHIVAEGVVAVQDGVAGGDGADGTNGTNGVDATVYRLVPTTGAVITNGTGTLTVEARVVTGTSDTLLSTGTIKIYDPSNNEVTVANGYATGSDGYTAVLDAGDINDSIVLTLKDGPGGTVLDTIALADIADGVSSNATTGWIEVSNGRGWRRATNAGDWLPAATFTDLTVNFAQAGASIASETRRVNLDQGTGSLTSALSGTNHADITVAITGEGTAALTVEFTHTPSGHKVAETVTTVQSGSDGAPGAAGSPGQSAIEIGYTASNGITSTQASDGTWTPSSTTSDIVFSFTRDGTTIATRSIRATRNNTTGNITLSNLANTGSTTTSSFTNNASMAPSVTVGITSGPSMTVTFSAALSGTSGTSVTVTNRSSAVDGTQNFNGSSSVTFPATAGQLKIRAYAFGAGIWSGSPPNNGTLTLFEDGVSIGTLTVGLANATEPGVGNAWSTSGVSTLEIERTRSVAAGNRVYTTTWSAGSTNFFTSNDAGVKIDVEQIQTA